MKNTKTILLSHMKNYLLLFILTLATPNLIFANNHVGVTVENFPSDLQLYPRNVSTNQATININGSVASYSNYQHLRLIVKKEASTIETIDQPLFYVANTANFSFTPQINAELSNYTFELYGIDTDGNATLEKAASQVVAGDVYIINGQSNAQAIVAAYPDDIHPFTRSFQTPDYNFPGWTTLQYSDPGQWGARVARNIADNENIPVAIFNQAIGGKPIEFFLRDDNNPMTGNYGKLHQRLINAGVNKDVRAAFWFQGEANGWTSTIQEYKDYLTKLHNDWKEDYNIKKTYVFQVRYQSCNHPNPYVLEAQRQIANTIDDLKILSTHNALHDECHFSYEGGYKTLGNRMYDLLGNDLYNHNATDVASPDIANAYFSSDNELTIEVTNTNTLQVIGYPWNDFKLESTSASITGGSVEGNKIRLQFTGSVENITGISYYGHSGSIPNWITNINGVGVLAFYNVAIGQAPIDEVPTEYVDIELNFGSDVTTYQNYTPFTVELTVTNNGNLPASGIITEIPLPTGAAFSDYNVSLGYFSPWNGQWDIGSLEAGQSTTISYSLFALSDTTISIFAQLVALNENDLDSSPNNSSTTNEDDEASITLIEDPNAVNNNDNSADTTATTTSYVDIELNFGTTVTNYQNYAPFTIQLNVTNTGDTTANGIITEIPLPEGGAFSDYGTSQGDFSPWSGNWNVGTLEAGQSAVLDYTLFALSDSTISVFAQIIGLEEEDSDSNPDNNASGVPNEDDETNIILIEGVSDIIDDDNDNETDTIPNTTYVDIELDFDNTVSSYDNFDYLTATLNIANTGNMTANGLVVSVPFPEGVAFSGFATSQGNFSAWNGQWNIGTLEAGQIASFSYTLYALSDSTISVFAQLAVLNEEDVDSSPSNNTTLTPFEDDEAVILFTENNYTGNNTDDNPQDTTVTNQYVDIELSLSNTVTTYDNYSFLDVKLNILNNGNITANGLVAEIPFPEGVAFSGFATSQGNFSAWNGQWNIDSLEAGKEISLTYTLYALSDSTISVFAQLIALDENDIDATPDNNTTFIPNEDDETFILLTENSSNFVVEEDNDTITTNKYVDLELAFNQSTTYQVYNNFTIDLTVSNTGNMTANNIKVDVPLPNGAAFSSFMTTQGNFSAWNGQWAIDSLPSGQTHTLSYTLYALSDSTITAFAQITNLDETDIDATPNNNASLIPTEDDEASVKLYESNTVPDQDNTASDPTDVEIYFQSTSTSFAPFSPAQLQLIVKNTGGATATNLLIDFLSPSEIAYPAYTVQSGVFDYVNEQWTINELLSGDSTILTVSFFSVDSDQIQFFAQVLSMDQEDLDSTPNNNLDGIANEDDEASLTLISSTVATLMENSATGRETDLAVSGLYPVPSNDRINLVISAKKAIEKTIYLFNGAAQLVSFQQVQINEGINTLHFNIRELPTGNYYFLFSTNEGKIKPLRFIKQDL